MSSCWYGGLREIFLKRLCNTILDHYLFLVSCTSFVFLVCCVWLFGFLFVYLVFVGVLCMCVITCILKWHSS